MRRLFLHIPKCGGMTIRRELKREVLAIGRPQHFASREYVELYREAMRKDGEHPGLHHCRLIDLKEDVRTQRIFTIVRNPWSRVVSRYFFAKQAVEFDQNQYAKNYRRITDFQSFLDTYEEYKERPFYWHRAIWNWYPAAVHVCDERGELKTDCLRTESLDQDLKKYLGIAPSKPRNVTRSKKPYQEMYSEKQIQFVADIYARDIELWGFDFDTPATRNIAV